MAKVLEKFFTKYYSLIISLNMTFISNTHRHIAEFSDSDSDVAETQFTFLH